MGHGVFQLGQVDGVCIFTTGSYAGDLTAGAAIANRKSAFCRLPGQADLGGRRAGLGVPAGDAACPVGFRALAQGDGAFHVGFCVLTDGDAILFGRGRVADGYGGVVGGGIIADDYGIAAVSGDFGAGGNGVLRSLIEGDGVEMVGVVRCLITVDGRTVGILISQRFIGGDFRLGHSLSRIVSRGSRMDILLRGSRIAVGITEDLRHFGRVAARIFIPCGIVLRCGLVAVGIDIIGHGLVGDLGRVADGSRAVALVVVVIADCSGAASLGRFIIIEAMGLTFLIDQLRMIIRIHRLAARLRIPFGHIAQGVAIGADGGIVLAHLFRTFGNSPLVANDKVAVGIIGCRGSVAESGGVGLRRAGQAEGDGQSEGVESSLASLAVGMARATGMFLAAIMGNLRHDDVAVLDFAPNDFVDVVHDASSISLITFSPCVAGCGACPP
nr:hypothetical protein [Mitsuokella multacida]